VTTGDAHEPYQVVGPGGEIVEPVSVFLRDLLASGKSEPTLRSYSVDPLRWWRFLDAVDVQWDRASRAEARDFSCWIQLTAKQRLQTSRPRVARLSSRAAGAPNPVTGKPSSGDGYAPSMLCELAEAGPASAMDDARYAATIVLPPGYASAASAGVVSPRKESAHDKPDDRQPR
jgi:hypothetical protein